MMNYGLWYYRRYFDTLELDNNGELKDTSQFNAGGADQLKNVRTLPSLDDPFEKVFDATSSQVQAFDFELKTTYPGLLCGVGYHHEINKKEGPKASDREEKKESGEFYQLGMYFDHTTGMPVIPGSSIKGALRSAVKNWDFLAGKFFNTLSCEEKKSAEERLQKEFINSVFEGKGQSIYERDIFFDAVPIGIEKGGILFGDDYITPHEKPLRNPVPIRFLRVNPGVTYRFRFILKDTKVLVGGKEILFSAEQKRDFFKEIILTFGLGAKTNVGYGRFCECK